MSASQLPTVRRGQLRTHLSGRSSAEPPTVLGRYHLHRRLGTGAFGTVWLAHDEHLDREVAVKIVSSERILRARFEREARAAARLSHPGIVTLYEAAFDDEGAYLVSELVRGRTLYELLQAGRLSDRDIIAIALSLCDALSHAHDHGVVHRDVKPSNVLVPDRPSSPAHPAKLTDFGVARVIGGDSLTRTGDVVGTAAYMAPEQAEGLETGAPADLYALALVTYEALTGVNPVRTTTAAVRARRLGAHLPPLRRQRRDLPRELGRGIDLALRPRPRERGSLDELRNALAACISNLQDTPGVIAPALTRAPDSGPTAGRPNDGQNNSPTPPPLEAEPAAPDWLSRGLAAVATAAVTAWIAAHLGSSIVAPAAVALLAAVLVLVLPRIGWLAATGSLAALAIAHGRPGGALVVLIAAFLPVILLPRGGASWPLPAAAPALGLIGLAGAWPALAARVGQRVWQRAALGAAGWLWLALASALAGVDLYARRPAGTPAPATWTESLSVTAHDVVGPLLTSGLIAAAVVWAIGAALLPWLVRGRSLAVDAVAATIWAAALASATETLLSKGRGTSGPPSAIIGAVASAIIALSPTLLRTWRMGRRSEGHRPELA